jgi:small subunit ribosomal protein S6
MATAQAQPRGEVWSLGSRIDTKREYESVTILRPDTNKQQITDLIQRMQKTFAEYGSTLVKIDSWGMRVLAYPVDKHRKGIYLYWRYIGGSDIVAEYERIMKLSDRVIRVLTFRVDEDVDPSARPSEVTEELLDAVSEPGPDPDELARQAAEAEAARRAQEEATARAARRYDDDINTYDQDDDDEEEGE